MSSKNDGFRVLGVDEGEHFDVLGSAMLYKAIATNRPVAIATKHRLHRS